MSMLSCRSFGTIAAIAVAMIVYHFYNLLGFATVLEFNDKKCTVFGRDILSNSEDMTSYRYGHVLISAGDLHNVFNGEKYESGGIFIADVTGSEPSIRQVEIHGLPKDVAFQPHGIYFSNATGTLYVVSHGLAAGGGSRIFVLTSDASVKDIAPKDLSFKYLRSVVHSHMFNGTPNDVIEGDHLGEIYLTHWLQYPLPAKGKHYPTTQEKLDLLKQTLAQVSFYGATVQRCVFPVTGDDGAPSTCAPATTNRFKATNGITRDTRRNGKIYVNDLADKLIHVYERDSTSGMLVATGATLETRWAVDNIEFNAGTQTITGGSIPKAYLALQGMEQSDQDRHRNGPIAVPGTAVSMDLATGQQTDILIHDGTKLCQTSAALTTTGGRIILGSPFCRGILVCPAP